MINSAECPHLMPTFLCRVCSAENFKAIQDWHRVVRKEIGSSSPSQFRAGQEKCWPSHSDPIPRPHHYQSPERAEISATFAPVERYRPKPPAVERYKPKETNS